MIIGQTPFIYRYEKIFRIYTVSIHQVFFLRPGKAYCNQIIR
jgi:hypothetical protein